LISITYSIAAILCPIIGLYIDRVGNRAFLITMSAFMMMLVHIIFMALPDDKHSPWGAVDLILLGVGYSFYATVM